VAATIVGDEDPAFAGGSYVMIQKYLHDHPAWNSLTTEVQEGIIGRRKLDDVELDDDDKPPYAHVALTVIEENGEEIQIRRHNMPFGSAGGGESGTYFIGYARSPRPIEQMLENMVVGQPPGTYDRLLDFTHPVTGGLFFVPSLDFLAALDDADDASDPAPAGAPSTPAPMTTIQTSRRDDGSLNIGSLRGTPQHG
jgi:putative iron-dependent peroxidase